MSTTRKTADQITAEGGGRIDAGKFDSFSETEIERMAQEDGEEEFFPRGLKPVRVARPPEAAE